MASLPDMLRDDYESCESADKTSIRNINEGGMKLRSMINHQNELLKEIGWKHINQNKNQKAKESIGTLTTLGTEITKACCQLVLEFTSQSAITQSCNQKSVEFYQSAQNWVGQLMLVNKNIFGLLGESDDNEAEDMIMAGPFHVRATLDLDTDDSRLLNWIFHSHEKDGDKCVAQIPTDTFPIKKCDMHRLLPEAWLSSFTINYVVEKLCFQENMKENLERWYFYLGSAVNVEEKRLMKIRDRSQLVSVKQFFFPIGDTSHFFLIVVDTQTRNMEVWDTSKKRKDIESYKVHLDNVCQTLNQIMQRDEFSVYNRILTHVPQQTNSYDCGVFVCYYLEHPQNVLKFHKKKWISEEQRFRLCLRILNTRHNTKRDLVYQDAELWSKQQMLLDTFQKDWVETLEATDDVGSSSLVPGIRNVAVGSASRIPEIRNECDTENEIENEDSWVKTSLQDDTKAAEILLMLKEQATNVVKEQDDTKAAEILLLLKEQATNVVKDHVGSYSRELEMYLLEV